MNVKREDPREMCERLESALSDGRFAEEPTVWRDHVEACGVCRAAVEGYFRLRERVEQARLEVVGLAEPTLDGSRIVEQALARYRFGRRRAARLRNLGYGMVGVLAIGGIALWAHQPAPTQVPTTDVAEEAIDYSKVLYKRVFPGDGTGNYDLLKKDEALREEYRRALDHRSSLVRRTALTALTSSGIEIDPAGMEEVLRTWNEDLERPVVVAAAGDARVALASALDLRRTATLRAVMNGAYMQAVTGGRPVAAAALEPFLMHEDVEVRRATMDALGADKGYRPSDAVMRVFTSDPEAEVRRSAAECLLAREGQARLIALFRARPDYPVEAWVSHHVAAGDIGHAFAAERLADPRTSIVTAILYGMRLAHDGITLPKDLVDRTIADGTAESLNYLVDLAALAKWDDERDRLQAHWKAHRAVWQAEEHPVYAGYAGSALVRWDDAAGTAPRLLLALDVCEAFDKPATRTMRPFVSRAATRPEPDISRRAKALLERWGPDAR